jgi:ABC-2 type transport system ATP-binding protein
VTASCIDVSVDDGSRELASLVRVLDDAGIVVESMAVKSPTLDDVFLQKTGEHLAETEEEVAA